MCELVSVDRNLTACLFPSTPPTHLSLLLLVSPSLSSLLFSPLSSFLLSPSKMVVAGFSGRTDLGKAAETANEVRRMVKELKECQQNAQLYNQRERLFNMPVTQVSVCI